MKPSELFDRGVQPERTLLAWGRTCLALAVVVAVLVKVLARRVGRDADRGSPSSGSPSRLFAWLLAAPATAGSTAG